jgi:serine protease Do
MNWNGRRYLPPMLIALTLGLGIVIGSLISRGGGAAKASGAPADALLLPAPSLVELSNSFSKVADALKPTVVNISTESTIHFSRRRTPSRDNGQLGDFFDRFFQFTPPGSVPPDVRTQSLGSGIILDKAGYILTNYHVIVQDYDDQPVDRIRVEVYGDDQNPKGYEGHVVGKDRDTDLAVVKIDTGRPLPFAPLGDSDSVRVGDWVLAIGSPFGLYSTVTAGIISAKGRDIEDGPEGQFKHFLQTDAAINPGNSGGPLVNLGGQVIGINTAIATRRGTYDGVDFAIPSNTARKVYNSIISSGKVRRGAIGVTFDRRNENNPVILRMFGADHGVVIDNVEAASPAERAGLRRGDVITSVEGKPVRSGDDLVGMVSDAPIGQKLRLEVLRDGKALKTEVEVGDRSQIVQVMTGAPATGKPEGAETPPAGGILGASVHNLTEDQSHELMTQLHLPSPQGVIVTEVEGRGFASDLGVQPGDVILGVNRKTVANTDDFTRLQSQLKSGSDVMLLIARRSQRTFITVYLADRLP